MKSIKQLPFARDSEKMESFQVASLQNSNKNVITADVYEGLISYTQKWPTKTIQKFKVGIP